MEAEINRRMGAEVKEVTRTERGFLENWMSKKQGSPEDIMARIQKEATGERSASSEDAQTQNQAKPGESFKIR